MASNYFDDWIEDLDLENYNKAPMWLERNEGCAHNGVGRLEVRNGSFTVPQKNKYNPLIVNSQTAWIRYSRAVSSKWWLDEKEVVNAIRFSLI